ncbi:MAG: M15 family metallopeptidase [Ruminococcus sp.]|nr:M15 family metallopeptidase [Ruminococcus sp.]
MGAQTSTNSNQHSQTPRNQKPRKKSRKVRYDRILIMLILIIGIIFLFTYCIRSCGKDNSDEKNKNNNNESSDVSDTTTESKVPENVISLSSESLHTGDLVIVNANYAYSFIESDLNLVTVYENRSDSYQVSDMEIMLNSEVITNLNAMMDKYHEIYNNTDIQIIGGYRSKERQDEKYAERSTMLAGGYSDYHTGRSFDIGIFPDNAGSNYYAPTGDYSWIAEHASEYGFIVRYPDGKADETGINPRTYTYRYVGLPHSTYIYENKICLEEYITEVKKHSLDNPLEINVKDTKWNVYYASKSTSGDTKVSVPGDKEYIVSGDNIDGFIIAYKQ